MAQSTAGRQPVISLMVMTFNEAVTLQSYVQELLDTLNGLGEMFEIVIIDDGSSDGSREVADRLAATIPCVRVIHHPENMGLGSVYRTGFTVARGEFVTFYPADGQFPASTILPFREAAKSADLVLGYIPRRPGLIPMALSFAERTAYWVLVGRLPRFQGIMMFRRELLANMELKSPGGRGWAVVLEFVLRASRSGCRVAHVLNTIHPRRAGASKVNNWRTIRANLKQVIKLRAILRG
jgi:glycosyltransferase involved in cell wall biosynthesis